MAQQRPFRFGVQAVTASSRDHWVAIAYKAEALGYSSLLLPDHFGDQLAPVPTLMLAAEVTLTLRVGAFVFDNDFKHPVVLAKEVATMDLLSDGRCEFGLGAGWLRPEYERAGIPFDPPGVRIARLAEALQVVKGLFAAGPFSYSGRYYTVTELDGRPKPLQQPHPPIVIGGGGQRLLTLAAREADIVSFNPRALPHGALDLDDTTPEALDQKVAWVREAAGDRFTRLELNTTKSRIVIGRDRASAARELAAQFKVSEEHALTSPMALAGTLDEVAEDLRERRERYGISYITIRESAMEAFAPVVARLAGQ